MSGFERHQAIAALAAAVAALFVASGYKPAARWRRPLRGTAIVLFLIACAAALFEVVLWLAGGQP
jgi:multisubunit Na+/H+ antiporter MnhB subunit